MNNRSMRQPLLNNNGMRNPNMLNNGSNSHVNDNDEIQKSYFYRDEHKEQLPQKQNDAMTFLTNTIVNKLNNPNMEINKKNEQFIYSFGVKLNYWLRKYAIVELKLSDLENEIQTFKTDLKLTDEEAKNFVNSMILINIHDNHNMYTKAFLTECCKVSFVSSPKSTVN